MKAFTIPDDLSTTDPALTGVLNYTSPGKAFQQQVLFTQHVFSFLVSGQKEIHHAERPIRFGPDTFALITGVRCLMTEISAQNDYQSILFFFDDQLLKDFSIKYADHINADQEKTDVLTFLYDEYLIHFRASIQLLSRNLQQHQQLLQAKFEEVMLYLLNKYPQKVAALFSSSQSPKEIQFRRIIENNKLTKLKIEDLAFLCNMSESTFKRHFQKYYAMPPHKYMLQERMKIAAILLQQDKHPHDIYLDMGYDTYSNFAKAFKQYYQISPRTYQQEQ